MIKAELGWIAAAAVSAVFFALLYTQRMELNMLQSPDQEAMYAAEIACAPHDGIKELLKAPKEEYRAVCKNGAQIWGPVKSYKRRSAWTQS